MTAFLCITVCLTRVFSSENTVDLSRAAIVVADQGLIAVTVLTEEVEKRTGLRWPTSTEWPVDRPSVVVIADPRPTVAGKPLPKFLAASISDDASGASARTPLAPESYAIETDLADPATPVVWVVGADVRGALYGVGKLLRNLECADGIVRLLQPLHVTSSPAYPIRGHQLGYRARANSYDAWTVAQYDQYIRELALFGANCIENIPFQDETSPHMKVSREAMNQEMSAICKRYDLDYWVWTPATFDLNDGAKRAAHLDEHETLYKTCPRLDAIFFPGGDPGENPPELVMPFLQDVSQRLLTHHPRARIWISLQGFNRQHVEAFYAWLAEHNPTWLGGVAAGPSSPPIPETRARLPRRYGLRHYPDITHTVRCQYPTAWLDPAFAFTLGREPINPQPIYYSYVHNLYAPYTDGFLTYSDGVNDDVNKTVWSALGWDPSANLREILIEYCRVFFGADVAETAADGIFALERNWEGPLATNGGVDATLALWQQLDAKAPRLRNNWRWQMGLLRAYYDAYTRHRLLFETGLEQEVYQALAEAPTTGADAAIETALGILKRADTKRPRPELRERIVELCDALFHSIGLQTSVEKYQASGAERGAVLDYVDYPLNNRWWLEDEMTKARGMEPEAMKLAHLDMLRTWESPGPGSFYDDIGNVAKSPHVVRGEGVNTDPNMERNPNPDFMWWDSGKKRVRQSWMSKMDWPLGLRYEGLDPTASYVVRTTGYRDCLLKINGVRIQPTIDGKEIGDFKEFPVPKELYKDRILVLTFDVPHEPDLNWRVQSRLNEVWLLKR